MEIPEWEIVWRGLFLPGHEYARLAAEGSGWRLEGAAVFIHANRPCHLDYSIQCDEGWRTRLASVRGTVRGEPVGLEVRVEDSIWLRNGEAVDVVEGCIDLDLNFSPSTNLLPIRRLALDIGASADVRAAWLRFPSFQFEVLEQSYTRVSERSYRYSSSGGKFVADLEVDPSGFVVNYPGGWIAEQV